MIRIFTIALSLLAISSFGQSKLDFEHYNNITEIAGTDYVFANAHHFGKKSSNSDFFMFINTRTGETQRVQFPGDASISTVKHLQYSDLGINCLMLVGRTVDLNNKAGINYNDPQQVIILSVDGKKKDIITEEGYYVKQYYISPLNGTIIILGYYDSNGNGHLDKSDKHETIVYDLKNMKQLSKT